MNEPAFQHVLSVDPGISVDEVQAFIQTVWEDFRDDPEYRQESVGDDAVLAGLEQEAAAPLQAKPNAEGTGLVTTILIAAAGGISAQYGVRALDTLWNRVILPRLQKKFGDRIKG